MKNKTMIVKATGLAVLMTLLINLLGGCTVTTNVEASTNLMDGIDVESKLTEKEMAEWLKRDDIQKSLNRFAVSLFKHGLKESSDKNLLISPISVLYAMSMCTNGADEETRKELLTALVDGIYTGEAISVFSGNEGADIYDAWQDNLNGYLASYLNATENYEGDPERPADLNIANSIWLKNDEKLNVEKDFLEKNGKFYNAGLFKANFDEKTRIAINAWIEENTKGLIKDMLREINEDSIMYLINALGFEAEWASPYYDYNLTKDEVFKGEKKESRVTLMHSMEYGYLKDELATGFIKYYAGYDYAFVGILPNEGVGVDEYIESLTGEGLYNMLTNISDEDVITAIPQFEDKSAMSLVDAFKAMGVKEAFDVENANFSKIGEHKDGNIFIGDILHNTFIKVDQKGTKAGAATIVEMACGAAAPGEPPKEVILDRPFVYMIIDTHQNIPLFIGVERNI